MLTKQLKLTIFFCSTITLLFCGSFVFFYHRYTQKQETHPNALPAVVNKALPQMSLSNAAGELLDDGFLRHGKSVLVFISPNCNACLRESDFLRTVSKLREDVVFRGIVSYGESKTALEAAQNKFPFEVFYDRGFKLAGALGVTKVPIKVFVEDGVIKKIWGGATIQEEQKTEFVAWLNGLR